MSRPAPQTTHRTNPGGRCGVPRGTQVVAKHSTGGAAAREAPATSRTEGEIKASAASGDRTRPSFGRHADATVDADGFGVEVAVGDALAHDRGELILGP